MKRFKKNIYDSYLTFRKYLIRYILTSRLFHASFLLTGAGIITGILGYIYQILVGRLLSQVELGLFSALISIITIFSSPFGALTLIVSKKISILDTRKEYKKINKELFKFFKIISICALIFIIVMYLNQSNFLYYIKSSNINLTWFFVGMIIVAALNSLNTAFFQGLQIFKWHVGLGFTWAILKIVSVILLVSIFQLGVNGAISGLLVSKLFVWIIGIYILYKSIQTAQINMHSTENGDLCDKVITKKSALTIIVATSSFVMMTQIDVILANYFYSPFLASQYAAAAILGKAVLYVPGGLVFALFPMVTSNDVKNSSSLSLIKQAICITTLLCMPICLFYFFYGEELVRFFYDDKYPQSGELLAYFGFAIFPMSIIMVLEHFLLAKGRLLFSLIFVILVPAQIIAIHFWHESLFQLIGITFVTGIVAIILGIFLLWSEISRIVLKR